VPGSWPKYSASPKHAAFCVRDLAAHGLPSIELTRLVRVGKLERIDRGMYGIPGAPVTKRMHHRVG
jgi:predicted transcriptional regulator of viral defense system